jgi:hypothetical protein
MRLSFPASVLLAAGLTQRPTGGSLSIRRIGGTGLKKLMQADCIEIAVCQHRLTRRSSSSFAADVSAVDRQRVRCPHPVRCPAVPQGMRRPHVAIRPASGDRERLPRPAEANHCIRRRRSRRAAIPRPFIH